MNKTELVKQNELVRQIVNGFNPPEYYSFAQKLDHCLAQDLASGDRRLLMEIRLSIPKSEYWDK